METERGWAIAPVSPAEAPRKAVSVPPPSIVPMPSPRIRRVTRPASLAQGSVTVPLPSDPRPAPPARVPPGDARLDRTASPSDRPAARRRPSGEKPAALAAAKPLPSLFAVIDAKPPRRSVFEEAPPVFEEGRAIVEIRVPRPTESPAEPAVASPSAIQQRPLTRAPSVSPAAPAAQAARRAGRRASVRADPRAGRPASFNDADAAFFAAGEELERDDDPFSADDTPEEIHIQRPSLWQRLTGRRL